MLLAAHFDGLRGPDEGQQATDSANRTEMIPLDGILIRRASAGPQSGWHEPPYPAAAIDLHFEAGDLARRPAHKAPWLNASCCRSSSFRNIITGHIHSGSSRQPPGFAFGTAQPVCTPRQTPPGAGASSSASRLSYSRNSRGDGGFDFIVAASSSRS